MNGDPQDQPKGEVIIYQAPNKKVQLEVKLEQETVWLTQKQLAELFNVERSVVTKHLRNIFESKELSKESNVQKMHIAHSDKPVIFYNLDAIISVGYRVNSTRATQFRIWATGILKRHLVEGYTLNEQRLRAQTQKLQNLQSAIQLIQSIKGKKKLEHKEALGLLEVISDYSYALNLLDDYDKGKLRVSHTSHEERFVLRYEEAIKAVGQLRKKLGSTALFGREKDDSFKSSIAAIYQTFNRKDLYPSVEEKAANLLYFIVKNHSP